MPMQSSTVASSAPTRQNSSVDYNYQPDDYDVDPDYELNPAVNVSDLPVSLTDEASSVELDFSPRLSRAEAAVGAEASHNKPPTEELSWGFSKLPNITAETNSDQRIVGGDEAIPGEIPWQVMSFRMQNGKLWMR